MKAVIVKANNLLSDPSTSAADLKALVKELKANLEFGLGCQVLRRMQEKYFPLPCVKSPTPHRQAPELNDEAIWVQQQLALCTYKDEDIHATARLPAALQILMDIGLDEPARRQNPETLRLSGAVYKRLWECRHKVEDLYASLALYERAWRSNPAEDMGYGGVNAAFILELLAHDARRAAAIAGSASVEATSLLRRAHRLRRGIRRVLYTQFRKNPGHLKNFWHLVSLAETSLGLALQALALAQDRANASRADSRARAESERLATEATELFQEAGDRLEDAKKLNADLWEHQTTARQLIKLILLHSVPPPRRETRGNPAEWHPAWRVIERLLGPHAFGVITARGGKVGLALSGGGFRASLFHLGVLARLAEMDVLRSVEVLSTVSGGSIIGAHYYLEVKHLLETTADDDLTREHYVEVVRRVQHNFLAAIQQNLRVRALGDWWSNMKVLIGSLNIPGVKRHTRSIRLAELYQDRIFNQVPGALRERDDQAMPDLKIAPAREGPAEEFRPSKANWRRQAKVPVLLLNSTSLNSGHNFQFTAGFMGEPPGLTGAEVDVNARYRRVYYGDIGEPNLARFPLGQAVAASACVPGLFEPIELPGLYPGEQMRLVDGGVHDNQGVAGLLDEDCGLILCSDASGQMDDQSDPSASRLGTLLRMNSILQDRVREAQHQELEARVETGSLEGLFFIHLKQDLDPEPIDWVDCTDPTPTRDLHTLTPYGIDRELQLQLSALRTDLDSFTEVEAYALMLSGYEMTRHQFAELARREGKKLGRMESDGLEWRGFDADAPSGQWQFQELGDLMKKPRQSSDKRRADLALQLQVGGGAAFKIWKLSPFLRGLSKALGLAAFVSAVVLVVLFWNRRFLDDGISLKAILLTWGLPLAALAAPALAWLTPLKRLQSIAKGVALVTFGWLLAWIHLLIFDRLFLRRGKVRRLLRLRTS